jgi:hypothetical protein
LHGALCIQRHRQLARLIRLVRRLSVIQIGCQRHKSLVRQALGHVFDVRHQAPPFLNHHYARMRLSVSRPRQIARRGMGIDGKFNHACLNSRHLAPESKYL